MLTFHLYVHDDSLEEFPGYGQVLGALGAGTDDEVADGDLGIFDHLDRWGCADVLVFGVGDSSEICFQVFRHDFLLFHFDNGSVLFFELEAILIQVDQGVNFFDYCWEADVHAVVPGSIVTIVVFMRKIKSHFYL